MKDNYSKNAVADKFYTNPSIAKQMIETLNLDAYDVIIEPSVGGYAFGRWLPEDKSYFFDLFPDEKYPQTVKQDFLQFDLTNFIISKNAKNVLIIGNPPFGRSSGLALKFIKHSCIVNQLFGIKTTVAFILSESFAKESFAQRIPVTHTLTQHVHLGSPFTVDDQPYNKLNCGWFVWEPFPRQKTKVKRDSHFIHFHLKEEWIKLETKDKCAIRTQGSGAGNVFWGDDAFTKNSNTTRFVSGPGVYLLDKIDWSKFKHLTVGIPSLSKSEIVSEVELLMSKSS